MDLGSFREADRAQYCWITITWKDLWVDYRIPTHYNPVSSFAGDVQCYSMLAYVTRRVGKIKQQVRFYPCHCGRHECERAKDNDDVGWLRSNSQVCFCLTFWGASLQTPKYGLPTREYVLRQQVQ